MGTGIATQEQQPGTLRRQAETDAQAIALWLHGHSVHTQRAYAQDLRRFLAFAGVPLSGVMVGHVQAFADDLEAQGPGSEV